MTGGNEEPTRWTRERLEAAIAEHGGPEGLDLAGAHLKGVDLRGANLTDAQVTDERLAQAKSLEGAIMPDGTVHD